MTKKFTLKIFLSLYLSIFLHQVSFAQFGNCYNAMANPIGGSDFVVAPVQDGLLCLGCNTTGISNLIDENTDDYVTFATLVNLFASNGIGVKNTKLVYPAGTVGGFNVDLGANLLNSDFLNSSTVSTYLDGVLQESHTGASLFAVPLFGSTTRRSFLYVQTTKPFNELRLQVGAVGTFLQTTRVHYAFTSNPECAPVADTRCDIPFAGKDIDVSFNGQLLSPLAQLINGEDLADADRYSYAQLVVPAGAISGVSAGVTDKGRIVAGGGKVGFVISPDNTNTLFSADVFNSFALETYLYGKLQETKQYSNGNGLVNISALAFDNGAKRQRVSMTTTLPYNEVRFKVNNQIAGVNLGSVRLYYAFHEGAACDGCESKLVSNNTTPYTGSLVTGNYGGGFFGIGGKPWTGRYGLALNALSGTSNVTDASSTNYATYTPVVGIFNSGANVTVKANGLIPAGTFGGFKIEKDASLIGGALFEAITVTFYNGTTETESKTGTSLLSTSILTGASGKATIGFVSTQPYDRIRINFNDGFISGSLGGNYKIYYAYVIGDADKDGVEDCNDLCPGTDDNADNDGDGLPDCQPATETPEVPTPTTPVVTLSSVAYPNPVVGWNQDLTVTSSSTKQCTYKLYAQSGVLVKTGVFTGSTVIKASNLMDGRMYVHVYEGTTLIKIHDIVVNWF